MNKERTFNLNVVEGSGLALDRAHWKNMYIK